MSAPAPATAPAPDTKRVAFVEEPRVCFFTKDFSVDDLFASLTPSNGFPTHQDEAAEDEAAEDEPAEDEAAEDEAAEDEAAEDEHENSEAEDEHEEDEVNRAQKDQRSANDRAAKIIEILDQSPGAMWSEVADRVIAHICNKVNRRFRLFNEEDDILMHEFFYKRQEDRKRQEEDRKRQEEDRKRQEEEDRKLALRLSKEDVKDALRPQVFHQQAVPRVCVSLRTSEVAPALLPMPAPTTAPKPTPKPRERAAPPVVRKAIKETQTGMQEHAAREQARAESYRAYEQYPVYDHTEDDRRIYGAPSDYAPSAYTPEPAARAVSGAAPAADQRPRYAAPTAFAKPVVDFTKAKTKAECLASYQQLSSEMAAARASEFSYTYMHLPA